MYFKRDIYYEMLNWKENNSQSKALQIEGSRQIGKTYIVRKFADEQFRRVYYFSLTEEPDLGRCKKAAEMSLSAENLMNFLVSDFEDAEDCVIVFDEIQNSSYIYRNIRPIVRGLKCKLIVTGSYLGRIFGDKEFWQPAGDLQYIKMFSLSFPEFLGINDKRNLYDSLDLLGNSNPEDYDDVRRYFRMYLITGGYPGVVARVLQAGTLENVNEEINEILRVFVSESINYMTSAVDISVYENILTGVARLLMQEKQGLPVIVEDLKDLVERELVIDRKVITCCITWLINSGVLMYCDCFENCDFSNLRLNKRIYFTDVGMARFFFNKAFRTSQVVGKVAENFAFINMLTFFKTMNLKHGKPAFATYFGGEIDFILFVAGKRDVLSIAFEIKSGRSSGETASKLIADKKIDFLVYAKIETNGGMARNIITIPLFLLGKFNVFDYVPDLIKQEYDEAGALIKEMKAFKLDG